MEQITHIQIGKIMRNTLLFVLIFGLFICGKCNREKLHLKRQNYIGNNIRIDGFYYNKPNKAHFFLYSNGIYYDGGNLFIGTLADMEYHYTNNLYNKNSYNLPYRWGVFLIFDNKIVIEKWISSDMMAKYPTLQFDGIIINDTTLALHYLDDKTKRDTFYFHKCNHKPDGTNKFID